MHYKSDLFHKYRNSNKPEDLITFKEQNKLVKTLIKSENLKTQEIPKIWRTINNTSGLGKTKSKDVNIQITSPSGNLLKGQDAAEHIN